MAMHFQKAVTAVSGLPNSYSSLYNEVDKVRVAALVVLALMPRCTAGTRPSKNSASLLGNTEPATAPWLPWLMQ